MSDTDPLGPITLYTRASERAAGQIIRAYSTSFGAATALLGRRHRQHIRNVYALVRLADELVDGVATSAGLPHEAQRIELDALERETELAITRGYSTNPIVHAFARTAAAARIGTDLTRPFFASMRMDLPDADGASAEGPADIKVYDRAAHETYVYGSAEVVGLMCLRVFVRDEPRTADELARLDAGARRLGAAFQNVNFLRDVADDTDRLERGYLGASVELSEAEKERWVRTIRADLAGAAAVLPLLPRDARAAVASALRLFAELTRRIERTPAAVLHQRRIRVPNLVKARIIALSWVPVQRGGSA